MTSRTDLDMDRAALAALLAAREVALEDICCGDSCCHIAVRRGQHTNGGCRCSVTQFKTALRINADFAKAVDALTKDYK